MIDDLSIVDLSYDDPWEPTVSVAAVVAKAERRRRRRHARIVAGLVILVAAAGGIVAGTLRDGRAASTAQSGSDQLAKLHNPSDPLVIVDRSVPGWESFVYISPVSGVCGGTLGTAGANKGNLSTTCAWTTVSRATTGTWVMKPVFQTLPAPWDNHGKVLGIGLVRGNASKVLVTFDGATVSATIVPIPVDGNSGFGAYAVWLPIGNLHTYGSDDISSVVSQDAAGRTVARVN